MWTDPYWLAAADHRTRMEAEAAVRQLIQQAKGQDRRRRPLMARHRLIRQNWGRLLAGRTRPSRGLVPAPPAGSSYSTACQDDLH